jgi:hypothetical protein
MGRSGGKYSNKDQMCGSNTKEKSKRKNVFVNYHMGNINKRP